MKIFYIYNKQTTYTINKTYLQDTMLVKNLDYVTVTAFAGKCSTAIVVR